MNWRGAIRRLIPYLIAIVGGFLLAYLVAAFIFFPSGVISQDLKVPNVIGLDLQTAQQRLVQAGFASEQGEMRFHATAPKGTVLDQNPPAGSKDAAGTKVTLVVSGGQRMGIVPNVVGMLRPDAERTLDQAGFDVGDVKSPNGANPDGSALVTSQSPAAGAQVMAGSRITLRVGEGRP